MEIKKVNKKLVSITASEGMVLKRKDTPLNGATEIKSAAILESKIDEWEEIPIETIKDAKKDAEKEREYKEKIVLLIREKYDADDEDALLRKAISALKRRETISDEFVEYDAYVEECKVIAKQEIYK